MDALQLSPTISNKTEKSTSLKNRICMQLIERWPYFPFIGVKIDEIPLDHLEEIIETGMLDRRENTILKKTLIAMGLMVEE